MIISENRKQPRNVAEHFPMAASSKIFVKSTFSGKPMPIKFLFFSGISPIALMSCCSKYFMQKDHLTTKARKKIHISDVGWYGISMYFKYVQNLLIFSKKILKR